MDELRTPTLRQAALFAILTDGILLVLGWLLIGPPKTLEPFPSFKVTAILGLPTITQLLEPGHQFSVIGFHEFGVLEVIVACLMYVLFLLASAYYIGLLARIKGRLNHSTTSAAQDAGRAWPTLFLWMLVQLVVQGVLTAIVFLIPGVSSPVALSILMILLLGFRFAFLYVEYAAVVLRLGIFAAIRTALHLQRVSWAESFRRFFTLCIVSFVIGFVVNNFFSVATLMITLVVNALVQTWLQQGLMESFFRGQKRLQG